MGEFLDKSVPFSFRIAPVQRQPGVGGKRADNEQQEPDAPEYDFLLVEGKGCISMGWRIFPEGLREIALINSTWLTVCVLSLPLGGAVHLSFGG